MNAVVPAKFIFRRAPARCLPRGRKGQRGSSSADGTGGDGTLQSRVPALAVLCPPHGQEEYSSIVQRSDSPGARGATRQRVDTMTAR
jgi:hypothetical protein